MADTTTIAILSVVISLLSFSVSAATMYFAWLRRGRLAMTKPTVVFFGYDAIPPKPTAKIFLRTLLYSTSAKGKMIESMYARLSRDGITQTFGFWGYGERNQLSPGSGLYVGQIGIALNHHFVLSAHHPGYEFCPGQYTIEIFARLVGQSTPIKLSQIMVTVDAQHAAALSRRSGVLFEFEPDTESYRAHIRHEPGLPAEIAPILPGNQITATSGPLFPPETSPP